MSLKAWCDEYNVFVKFERGVAFIVGSELWNRAKQAARADLFHLTDYVVSSNSGGCYVLVPKTATR